MATVNIAGLDKAKVLQALHQNSKAQGMSFLHEKAVSIEDCEHQLARSSYVDYFAGRVIKCDLGKDEFDTWGYDRDNGDGAAQKAIDLL